MTNPAWTQIAQNPEFLKKLRMAQIDPEEAPDAQVDASDRAPAGGGKLPDPIEAQKKLDQVVNSQPQTDNTSEAVDALGALQGTTPAHSGLKVDVSKNNEVKGSSTSARNYFLSPQDIPDIAQALGNLPFMTRVTQGADSIRDLLFRENQATHPQMDLSPLLALSDSQTGSNLLKGYTKPETALQTTNRAYQSAVALQAQNDKIAELGLHGITSIKAGQDQQMLMSMMAGKYSAGSQDPYNRMRLVPDETKLHWVTSMAQSDTKSVKTDLASLQKGLNMLNADNSVSQFASMDSFIKGLVGGRITNYELANQRGDRSYEDQVAQWFSSAKTGQLTIKNVGEYVKAFETLIKADKEELNARLGQSMGFGRSIGLPDDRINQAISGLDRNPVTPPDLRPGGKLVTKPKPTIPTAAPGSGDLQKALEDELNSRGGK